MIDIENTPRPWGGGNHLSQTDMDDLEVRKVRALERIADALDGGKTSKYSGVTIEKERFDFNLNILYSFFRILQ